MEFCVLWAGASILVLQAFQVHAFLPIPTLHFENKIIEDDDTNITCTLPYTAHMDVQLEIKGNVKFTDCATIKGNNSKVTCMLEVTKDMHEMEFTCEALFKTQSQPQKMYIQTEPSFTDCPDKQMWIEGQINSFHCNATGYPLPTVTCNKDDTKFVPFQKFTASKHMSGNYKCRAQNFDKISKTVTVSVQYKPENVKIAVDPSLHQEGDNVRISCEADGNPAPTYNWSTPSPNITFSHDNKVITVQNMKKSHLGRYICTAQNEHGAAAVEEDIALEAKPIISNIIVKPSMEVIQGKNVTLACEAMGFPPPSYSWQTPTRNVVYSKDQHNITIQKADKEHDGIYTCTVKNMHGSDAMTRRITVEATEDNSRGERTELTLVTLAILTSMSLISHLC
ncbi:intercellular adhesion molecule 5-like isoform X2 [Pseudophryne corroboree]|uniref:intercellular adhesion molecule 5-like isoform X2 n=1 Tax=Pseudophryne corroboree TaxID=495146 RepID=UPI0030815072